jgi:hypothetical protein
MSRSRKKNPIYKDKGYSKYNRIFRAKNKQRLRQLLVDESTVFVLSNEAVNQYNICDYIVRDLYKFYNNENVYKAYIK